MSFKPPDTPLASLTPQALTELGLAAAAAYETLRDSVTPETVTDEQIAELKVLKDFTASVDTELAGRASRAAEFAALTAVPAEPEKTEPEPEKTSAPEPGFTPVAFATVSGDIVPQSTTTSTTAVTVVTSPTLAQIAPLAQGSADAVARVNPRGDEKMFSIFAAPDAGYAAGTELEGWMDTAKAFINRSRAYIGSSSPQQHSVAVIERQWTEGNKLDFAADEPVLKAQIDALRNPKKLTENALTAGVGWCAPSETVYSTCSQITISGIFNATEIGARRGGIRHNQGIQFDTIFGSGTGYNILTEAQVIADTAKTCVAIPCPSFVDDRLKVSVLCLTGDILQNRAYPEFVAEFMQGAIAAQAHNVNRQVLADIIADSTAVALSAVAPWANDGTVLSQVLSAAELAAVDTRYRLRLRPEETIEQVFPIWLLAQIRADWVRRNATYTLSMTDAMISALFAERNIRVQWVYDLQDAFTSSGVADNGLPGADTAITALPTSVSFLSYPAGTWVIARQDVIRLEAIYDSTNITTNKVTQLFLEDGFRAMRFCPLSRYYTVGICPSGATGIQRDVACAVA